jgi:hypothetical protein
MSIWPRWERVRFSTEFCMEKRPLGRPIRRHVVRVEDDEIGVAQNQTLGFA